jgi:hypothetical protein
MKKFLGEEYLGFTVYISSRGKKNLLLQSILSITELKIMDTDIHGIMV